MKSDKKRSKHNRKPSNSNERFLLRIAKSMLREHLDDPAVRAGFIGKGLRIPLRGDDLIDPITERLKAAVVEALMEDLKSPDSSARERAYYRLKRLSGDSIVEPVLPAPQWVREWRRRGRPRKDKNSDK